MEERIGLVFSWDPRAQHWVKERGPDDAPPPPADPIDNEAVQTYFLDPNTGRWNGTILGLKARQMTVALGDKYRNPRMVGLAIIEKKAPRVSGVPTPDQKKKSPVPLMAGIAAVVVVIAGGAFAAQAVMKPRDVATQASPSAATTASALVTDATPGPTSTDLAATPSATTAPTQAPQNTPQRTVAPTAPPPAAQTVIYTSSAPNGAVVTYNGPNAVVQGGVLSGALSLRVAGGYAGTEPLTLYVGPLGAAQSVTLLPDKSGNFTFSMKVTAAKGTYPLSYSLGRNGEIRILGNFSIR